MNVVIYSRVSSQSTRQSTERQVVDLERFATGRGDKVVAVLKKGKWTKGQCRPPGIKPLFGILHRFAEPGGYVTSGRDFTLGTFHLGNFKGT